MVLYSSGMAHRKWLPLWVRSLILESRGVLRKPFAALRSVVLSNLDTCNYVLPFLLLDVIRHGTEHDRRLLVQELLAVLHDNSRRSTLR